MVFNNKEVTITCSTAFPSKKEVINHHLETNFKSISWDEAYISVIENKKKYAKLASDWKEANRATKSNSHHINL